MATIAEAFQIATQHYQAGRLQLAGEAVINILAAEPSHADALCLLGLIAHQHNQLGIAFSERANWDDAIACFRRALELKPGYVECTTTWAVLSRTGES